MAWSDAEHEYMRRAIEVAEKGRGQVRPNPLVGCVLVKDGKVIAEGWHDHLGGLHAEQMAIHDAEEKGHNTNGATAYVTLEPCNHFGRTPPLYRGTAMGRNQQCSNRSRRPQSNRKRKWHICIRRCWN